MGATTAPLPYHLYLLLAKPYTLRLYCHRMPRTRSVKTEADALARDLTDLKLSPETKEAMRRYMPYLEEAQKRLLFTLAVFILVSLLSGIFYKQILIFILSRFDLTGVNMVLTSPFQVIELAIKTGIYTGIVITLPLLIYNLITFLKPALEPKEFSTITRLLPFSALLFVLGFVFGVWVMNFVIAFFTKTTLEFSIGNIWDINQFFSQILFTGLTMALVFQFPIVITILMRLGLVKKQKFVKNRPIVYVGALIFAALLPPTDVFSLVILTLPLFFLFEIALILNKDT